MAVLRYSEFFGVPADGSLDGAVIPYWECFWADSGSYGDHEFPMAVFACHVPREGAWVGPSSIVKVFGVRRETGKE
jgi:hypothetical protein